jgi:acyl-CoA reductase-like NAD-dependent aldehyde dehydrogenase
VSYLSETLFVKNSIIHALENLDDWVLPEKMNADPILFMTDQVEVRSQPLGVALIISPWN